MNILITGGTGFIGTPLTRELRGSGHQVTITTRGQSDSEDKLTWTPPELIPPEIISRFDAVINLAGEPIAPDRWSEERKKRILSSRVNTTHALVESIRNSDSGPKILISASAIGIYGSHKDEEVTEDTSPASDFLADVCIKWEAEAQKAADLGVRVVIIRIGGVLESDGGALAQMATPFKLFLGGPIGSGKQWFSWIHRDDVIGIIKYALENKSIAGPVNATAPNPVRNKEFSEALGKALHRPSGLAVPGLVVKLALGELGEVLLTGQRVIAERALKAGYTFRYTEIHDALNAIYKKAT